MKKNSSLTYSLLLLPLIASSSLLSMEHNDEASWDGFPFFSEESAEEVAQEPTIEFQPAATEYHPITTNPVDYNAFPFLNELAAELSVDSQIDTEKQTNVSPQADVSAVAQTTTEEQPNALSQSAMLPTKEKGLGFFGTISYYCKDVITNIISYLSTKTFDTDNKTHFALLNEAVQKAAANNDFDTLVTIAALCQSTDNYQANIRISDEVAQPALDLFTTKYAQEVKSSNDTIRNNHQTNLLQYNKRTDAFAQKLAELIIAYNEDIKIIASNCDASAQQEVVHITTIQQAICTLGKLNAVIRPATEKLPSAHTITIPKNRINKKIGESEHQLKFLSEIGSKLPKIKDRTLTQNLQLETQ